MAARLRRARLLLLFVFVAAVAGVACAGEWPAAQAASDSKVVAAPAAKPAPERPPAATLTVFNRPIVTFRSAMLGSTPRERVAAANSRIVELLERGGEGAVSVEKVDVGNVVKIDGRLAFVIGDDDAEQLYGETLATVTGSAVDALKRVIAETREVRDGRLMVAAVAWAGGATLIYLALLVVLRFVGRTVSRRMQHFADAAAERVRIGGAEVLSHRNAIRFARLVVRITFYTVALLLTYQWIGFVLSRFPFTRVWGEHLNAFLTDTTFTLLSAIAQSIPELVIVAVIFVLARGVVGLMRNFFDGVQSRRIQVGWLDADSYRCCSVSWCRSARRASSARRRVGSS